MRIGIIGTRGIPNQHGGFEQFVEFVAPLLVSKGHEVFVYNSSLHPYDQPTWKGVHLIKKHDPENKIGTAGQFLYDFNCIIDSRQREFDVILQLGYTSSSIWSFLFPKKTVIVTNMDGLEWKRSKYSKLVRQFLTNAEKWAALYSDTLIADSKGIQEYLLTKYNKQATYIAYGATLFQEPDDKMLGDITKYSYNLLIARMEPENNIETILEGHKESARERKFILIGNHKNKYGSYLRKKYEDDRTQFWGSIYDLPFLNNLRHFSHLYFHGHSVGGTNPSLLEAMASQSLIVANDNIFNRSVLENDAFYFSTSGDVATLIDSQIKKNDFMHFIKNNNNKISTLYSWNQIAHLIEKKLLDSINGHKK